MPNKTISLEKLNAIYHSEMIKAFAIKKQIRQMDDDNLSFLEVSKTNRDLSRIMGKLDVLELIINDGDITGITA